MSGTGLVDDIDRLVRQMPVVDVAVGQFNRGAQRLVGISDLVVILKAGLQSLQDFDRFIFARFADINFLETTRKCPVFFENSAIFLISGGADAFQFTGCQHRFDQVGCVHDTARGRARADNGVNLVDEQDRAFLALQLCEYVFQPLLEITAILGTGQQCAEIQRINGRRFQYFRNFLVDDLFCQSFRDGSFADAGLTNVKRIVLATTTQNLNRAFNFILATNQGIDFAELSLLVEVGAVSG